MTKAIAKPNIEGRLPYQACSDFLCEAAKLGLSVSTK